MTGWSREIRKGAIQLCLLAQLRQRRMYGFEIIRVLRERSNGFFDLKEGTLYPALHRLEKRGLVEAETVAQEGRPPRKYYHLTLAGAAALAEAETEWNSMTSARGDILDG